METWGQNWMSNWMSIGPTRLSLYRWPLPQWLKKLWFGFSALEQTVFAIDRCFFSFTVDVCLNHRQQNFFRAKFIQGLPKENECGARSMKEGITFKGLMVPSHFLTGMYKSLGEFLGERSVWIREVWILNIPEQFKVHSKIRHRFSPHSKGCCYRQPAQQAAVTQRPSSALEMILKLYTPLVLLNTWDYMFATALWHRIGVLP